MQVSMSKVLRNTLNRISNKKPSSGNLDSRFSNFYASKTREDVVAAARQASIKSRA